MKRLFYFIGAVFSISLFIMLYASSIAWADSRGLGFIPDVNGNLQKVLLHTRKELTFGRGFPFIERPVAVSITESSSDKELARIELDPKLCDWIYYDAYALDGNRIVLNGYGDQGRNTFVAVWDWKKHELRFYNNSGSRSPESVSGISPDEQWVLEVPTNLPDGLILHDLKHGSSIRMYKGLFVLSPRFSPGGEQWAFFSRDELILRSNKNSSEKRAALPGEGKWRHGRHLAWSPSGRYIAGIIHHEHTDLVIWDCELKQLKTVGAGHGVARTWPPIWSSDEKSVYIVYGNEALTGKREPLQIRAIPLW